RTYFNAFVRDISDWHHEEERQSRRVLEAELISDTAVETASAGSFEESLQVLLDAICDQIKWPLGHVWLPDETDRYLTSSGIWHNDPGLDADAFRVITEKTRFRRGEGLPGLIWEIGQPRWIDDIVESASFPRANHCPTLALRSAFAFPVRSAQEVVAVLEFFHTNVIPEDYELLKLVGRLGNRIGDVVQSRRFERQQAKLAAIVGSSYDAIIAKSLDGTITSWNAGAERVYGYTEDEAVGRTIRIVLPNDVEAEEPEVLRATETGQRLEQFETVRKRKDGTLIPVSLTVSPIADTSGRIVGSSAIERDISSQERREKELHAAKDVAERANRTRGEFLANVSHEIRTPMNAIIGMTQLALEEALTPALRDYLETASEAADSLLRLLNDILDFSKLESGKFTIGKEEFSLAQLVDETVKTVSTQAFAKGLELVCEMPTDLPRPIIGDPMRLRQILTNLLSNAIKFTEQGEISLCVETIRTWPSEVRLRFSVRDTGIGIPAEEHNRILEPFTQVDSSSARKHGGTGLGLAICSELLRLQGGQLSLKSAPDQGSTFSFRLSFELPDGPTKDSVDGIPFEQFKQLPVLVVDDNETNRRIISESLKAWSLRPTVANDAAQAIGLFERAAEEGHAFPLVIVDALMPGMDGYELSRTLTERTSGGKLPIIMMVSSADRRDFRDREEQANIAVYLQKPVTQSDLMCAVMRVLELQSPELQRTPLEVPSGERIVSLSVLLAEDTPANQKVVTAVLKKRGHSVTVADNGREAVKEFKRARFDVVLMDVQMPILDGYQTTAAMREVERERGTTTPIIAMTAHAMRGDREKCLAAGMDAYIAKPLDVTQLLGLIESITEEQAEMPHTISPRDSDQESTVLVIDYADAMKRLGNDVELYREFIGFYEEDSKSLFAEIEAAIASADAAQLQHAAHSLKGLVANLGAMRVVEATFALEQTGKSGNLNGANTELAVLRDEMMQVEPALQQYRG
ncbi:MAG: response regulator, partial [Planctomycetota bacterium]